MSDAAGPQAASLEALAAQVGDLRAKLRMIEARLFMLGLSDEADVPGQFAALAARVDQLGQDLAEALEAEQITGVAAVDWPRLDDEGYERELGRLAGWVDTVLRPYYPGAAVPACWPDHPDIVINLSNIYGEWRRVYDRKRPDLAGALDWHERWLPGAVARIRQWSRECTGGACSQRKGRQLAAIAAGPVPWWGPGRCVSAPRLLRTYCAYAEHRRIYDLRRGAPWPRRTSAGICGTSSIAA